MMCDYGCNQESSYLFKNGKRCCSKVVNSCPKMRERNGAKKVGKPSGRSGKTGSTSWSKGLTKEVDSRLKDKANAILQRYKDGTLVSKNKGRVLTKEHRTKISLKMMGNKNAHHRGDRQSYYGDVRMDSRWEVGVAGYLASLGCNWKYGETGYKLSDGRYYYPDFFIYKGNRLDKIIEVKGYFRTANREKFNTFLKEYPSFVVELWDRGVLTNLGIIDRSGYVI